jgi:cyclohexadieny/prephenate dehydrogenase
VIFCVPPLAMGDAARCARRCAPMRWSPMSAPARWRWRWPRRWAKRPGARIIPAHPVAGTENSGPDAGFASLFKGRWCIITPPRAGPAQIERLAAFWQAIGARVEIMDAAHHDRVLAVTSHLPHLIAYTIVGTASDLEEVTQSEVIKYSAGGFRDFTRIAASDPTMWRDVFLSNRDAVLEMLQASPRI